MSITRRLGIGLAAALLIIVAAGVIAIRIILDYERELETLQTRHLQGAISLAVALDALWQLRWSQPHFMVTNEEGRQQVLANEPKLREEVERELRRYARLAVAPQDKEAVERLLQDFERYASARRRFFELYAQGKVQEAAAWQARNTMPLGIETTAALERQIIRKQDSARLEMEYALADARRSRGVLYGVLGALGVAIGLVFLLAIRTLRPLRELRRKAEDSVREHFGEALETHERDEVKSLVGAFERLRQALHTQSFSDPLTGLCNRRFLDETLQRETARAQRTGKPLAVLMIDVDHFKRFNDSFGHEAGDLALRSLGQLLREHFRVSDYCCRYGGEELAVIMPEAALAGARARAERLREAAARLEITQSGRALGPITLSIGLAVMPDHGRTPEALLQAADEALYQAKQAGGNRVLVSGAAE